jgi:tetratricopeptide (TPR) repeat protein/transcriptional regulator with XRE-family HTH domain
MDAIRGAGDAGFRKVLPTIVAATRRIRANSGHRRTPAYAAGRGRTLDGGAAAATLRLHLYSSSMMLGEGAVTEHGIQRRPGQPPGPLAEAGARVETLADLAALLRTLRRQHARARRDRALTYRELAGKTGWSHAAIAEYFTARTLPPTDRFDALLEVLGAAPDERRALANARDRVEESIRQAKGRRAARPPAPSAPEAEPAARPEPMARQLPAAPAGFTGRAREVAVLDAALNEQAQGGGMLAICALGGLGGVGKTWLALHWAHQNIDRFPDGQLYANLRGFDPTEQPVPAAAALCGFLDALGVPPGAVPVDTQAQAGLYRSLLADKRMLVVLDNAHDADQVVPLLPGGSGCTVLVTSRHHLGPLVAAHGARALELDVLPAGEAREVLVRRLGGDRIAAEPQAVGEVLTACAGLPLALGIVAARAARHPTFPLAALAADLRDASHRLDALDPGDRQATLRAVLSCSVDALRPEAAGAFSLLALAPGGDIGPPAAAALLAAPPQETQALLHELEDACLLQQHTPGRYHMHDLVRIYAHEHAAREHTPGQRDAALRRVLDFYAHTAHDADHQLHPYRKPVGLEPNTSGDRTHAPADEPAAMAWFRAEHLNLLAAQRSAAAHARHRTAWQLAWSLVAFHCRRGDHHDSLAVWQAALDAAPHLPEPAGTLAHLQVAHLHAELGHHEEAVEHARRALARAEANRDLAGQARAHREFAWAWQRQGEYGRALGDASRALELFRIAEEPIWEATLHNDVGWYAAHLGDYDSARAHCEAALELYRSHRHVDEANVLDSLGYIAHHAGRDEEAIRYYQQALDLMRARGNTYDPPEILEHLGHAHAALGHDREARAVWQPAMELYRAQHRTDQAEQVARCLEALTT